MLLKLAMLINAQLKKFTVGSIGIAECVPLVWVRCRKLLWREKLLWAALLKFSKVGARILCEREQLFGDVDLSHMVAADLSHNVTRN